MKRFFWLILIFFVACQQIEPPVQPGVPETPPQVDLSPSATTASWSDPASWPAGRIPAEGEDVVIPEGQSILLDLERLELATLTIKGTLVFANQDIDLRVSRIIVDGRLELGVPSQPYTAKAKITLTGSKDERTITVASRGSLIMHAASPTAWTRLGDNSYQGDSQLRLAEATDWQVGNEIVVASTDFDFEQAEKFRILKIAGNQLELDQNFAYKHWGKLQTYNGQILDERAEVANLTRAIVIQGDASSVQEGIGGHIMVTAGGQALLDGVELYHMGQRGEMGRYPIHWHLLGDLARGQYLKNSSVHSSFNRCVTIHGSNGVQIINNVTYKNEGHCFFLEDGAEQDNIFRNNLAIATYSAEKAILPTDDTFPGPSSYWITNPDNLFENNVAAGSAGSGFWYALPENPTGPSASKEIWPRFVPLAGFRGNVAHSNHVDGLHVDSGPTADLKGVEPAYYDPRVNPNAVVDKGGYTQNSSKELSASFESFLAYKNRRNAVWLRGQNHSLTAAILADNGVGVTLASQNSRTENSLFIGESQNLGTPELWMISEAAVGLDGRSLPRFWDPDFSIRGFEFYDGNISVENSHFEAFSPNEQRQAAALSYLDFTHFPTSPRNSAIGLSFAKDTNPLYLATRSVPDKLSEGEDGYRSAVFIDEDGSVSGQKGVAITVNNPFLLDESCSFRADWNAHICSANYASLQFSDEIKTRDLAPLRLIRDDGLSHQMLGNASDRTRFISNVRLGRSYHYDVPEPPSHIRLSLRDIKPDQSLELSLRYPYHSLYIYRDYWIDSRNLLHKSSSLAELKNSRGNVYFLDAGVLHLKLFPQNGKDWAVLDVCQQANCK